MATEERSLRGSVLQRHALVRGAYHAAGVLLLWLALAAALLVDFAPFARVEPGAVSSRDIRTSGRFSYVSEIRTERERERQASTLAPIYSTPDRSRAVTQSHHITAIADYLAAVRADSAAEAARRVAYVRAVEAVPFSEETAETLLDLDDARWQAVVGETRRLVDSTMRGEITEGRLPTVLALLPNQISTALDDQQVRVVREWASALITPNSFLDAERTEAARAATREQVEPIAVTLEAGQIIVREGDVITPEQVEALNAMGYQAPTRAPTEKVSMGGLLLLLAALLALYLNHAHPDRWASPRAVALVGALLAGMAFGARLIMGDHLLLSYLFPTATAAMLLAVLLGPEVGLLVTVFLTLIVGLLTGSMEMMTYTFVGGWLGTLLLWRVDRLSAFVRAGLLVGLALAAVVFCFALLDGHATGVALGATMGMALLNGAASASLALAGFYTLGAVLGTPTFLQLMELARPSHPLFRELLLKASGTYHHSIIVSNLAERAAEAVGADMLLVRVAAYYHDVGKTLRPHFFIENQSGSDPLHERMDDPHQSAEIILNHVRDGVKLARRHGLPTAIVDCIEQHHGTSLVLWFYRAACDRFGAEAVDAERFRYPGPRPQSREAAILMLADTVEATARAVKPRGAEALDGLIQKAFADKLADGQLDDCALTLRDLIEIRQAFVGVLQGIYHPRIAYPEPLPKPSPAPTPETRDEPQREPYPDPAPRVVGEPR